MAVPVFDPDAPSEEVAAPRFDPTQAFEEVPAPRFDPQAPFEEYDPRVAKMATATRHTVGVVGRAVAATDFAIRNIPDPVPDDSYEQQLADVGLTEEQAEAAKKEAEGVWVLRGGKQVWFPSKEAAKADSEATLARALKMKEDFEGPLLTLPRANVDEAFAEFGPFRGRASKGAKVAAGVYNAAKTLPEFFTSQLGVSLLASGNLPEIARRLIAAGFAVDMAAHSPEQIMALANAVKSGDTQAIAETATALGMTGAFVGMAGKHSLPRAPLTAAEVAGRAFGEQVKAAEFVDPKLAALRQVAPLTAEAVVKVEPVSIDTKPAESIIPTTEVVEVSTTPLTTAAVESVKAKEPAPEAPAPAPPEPARSVAGEAGAGKPALPEPPAGINVTAEQWEAMAHLNDAQQRSKYGTTRGDLFQQAMLSRKESATEKPSRESLIASTISNAKKQVGELKASGEIPKDANTFSDWQEHIDANELINSPEIGAFGKANKWKQSDYIDFTSAVIEALDKAPTPERIVATAVRNPTTGKIVSAPNKIHVQLYEEVGLSPARMSSQQVAESSGYMTDRGRFVLQDEGQRLAQEAQQVKPREELMGEVVKERISKEIPAKPQGEPPLTTEPVAKAQAEVSKVTPQELTQLQAIKAARDNWKRKGDGPIYPPLEVSGVTPKQFAALKKKGLVENRGFGHDLTMAGQYEANPEFRAGLDAIGKPTAPKVATEKIQEEVSKVASEEGQRSAKDIKEELIDEIQEKLTKAPSEAVAGDKVTIEIPGDGTFTIPNTVEALSGMLERAKKIKTDPGKAPGVPKKAIKNSERAISQTAGLNEEIRKAQEAGPTVPLEESVPASAPKASEAPSRPPVEPAPLKFNTGDKVTVGDGAFAREGTISSSGPTDLQTRERSYFVRTNLGEVLYKESQIRTEPSEPQGAIATPGPPLAPSATPAPVLPPKSQRQIITDIAQGLKLPIRFGRLRTNRFAGYFLKLQNLIGSKRANDIPIVSHEAGHKLDATFNFSNDPALRAELEMLGDPAAFAGSRSSWTTSKSIKYKRGEGVAEFVRYYLTDPPAATKHAPAMARAFEAALDSNKDFGDTMRQAQSDIQTWRNAEPQARLRSHISVGGNPNKTPYTVSQLTRDLVDDLHFLRLAANDAKAAGAKLDASQNPYTLARTLRGSYGMADSFIRSGVADFKTREVTLGTSLQDALKPVAGRIADFRDWIIAKRAQELHGQGRETGLVNSDVAFTAAKFDGDAAFQDAFAKVKAWQDKLLQYAVDSGFVTKDGAAAMREMNQDYVPLHRVFEVGAGEAPAIEGSGTGRGLNVGKPGSLRRLTGSSRDIVDPLETMVRNAYAIITASEKHAINIAVADMANLKDMGKWVEHIKTPQERVKVGVEKLREQLEAEGADMTAVPDDVMLQFFQNSKSAPFGENVIKIVRDGKPEFYRLKRELFETFNALDLEDSGTLVRMLSAPSQVLRAGVVLDPSFSLANVMRDAFTSSIVSRHGLLPFEATLRGVAAMLKNPKLVAEWEAAGGKNAIEANYFDRQKLQKFLAEKITKDLTPAERALITVKSPLQALRWLTSLGEEATRIGEYQKAFEDLRKGGMSEGDARRQAAFESRDRQDFAKGGAKTKIPRRLAAFWNAGIQGNIRLAQAFKERPMQTTMKGLAFITIPKLIEQSLNWDDEDYWDRPQWERDLFFLIPAGKGDDGHTQFIRIPTPFEAGIIFGTLPGRILQSIRESSAENMKSFPGVALKQTIPNPTPQFALTIFEDFMVGKRGYDVYRGRQIVPESIAQLPADMQWTEQTSLAARKLGAALGFPPVKIDHIINQTTGGLGKQLTHQVVDRAISAATGEERTAKGVVPGGRFVTTPAAVSSQAIDDFYTTLDKVKTAAAGEKKGRDDELARWKPMFTAAESRMSELRRAMRQTKDEAGKDAIAANILALARQTMKDFRKAKKDKQP